MHQFLFIIIIFYNLMIGKLIVLSLISFIVFGNLICQGDFEAYSVSFTYNHEYQYRHHSSDSNCWYKEGGGKFSIQTPLYMQITKGAQLTTTSPYTLCQTVTLNIGQEYIFGYGLFCPRSLTNMLLTVTLNSMVVDTMFIATQSTINSKTFEFIANVSSNQFCFSEVHDVDSSYSGKSVIGGMIDNITLEAKTEELQESLNNNTQNSSINQIENQIINSTLNINHTTIANNTSENYYPISLLITPNQQGSQLEDSEATISSQVVEVIYFKTIVEQLLVRIKLVSDYSIFSSEFLEILQLKCQVKIEDEIQNQVTYIKGQSQNLQICIQTQRKYDLSKISISIEDFHFYQSVFKYEVYIDNKKVNFSVLNVEERQLVASISPVIQVLAQYTKAICIEISSSLSSYFIVSLFGFWNISLMYNFLLLSTFPSFARKVYEILMETIYQKNSLINWLINNVQLPEEIFQLKIQQQMTENMDEFAQSFSWFGVFGFSSKVINNDIEIFITAFLLIGKLFLLSFIIGKIPKSWKKKLKISINYPIIFIYEIISTIPFMTISSVTALKNAVASYQQKISKIIQILLFFLCIIIIVIWYLKKMSQIDKSYKQQIKAINNIKRDEVKIYESQYNHKLGIQFIKKLELSILEQQTKKQKVEVNYEVQYYLLFLTFPFLLITSNQFGFLSIHSILIVARAVYFLKNIRIMDRIIAFFQLFMMIIWITHHFVFVAFYIFEELIQINVWTEQIGLISPKFAITVIFTIILGGGIQLLKLVIEVLLGLFKFLVRIKNIFCDNKVVQNNNNKSKNKIIKKKTQIIDENKMKTSRYQKDENENVDRILIKLIIKKKITQEQKKQKKFKKQKLMPHQPLKITKCQQNQMAT